MYPDWGSNLQPRHVSWPGIEPMTFLQDNVPTSWATLARASHKILAGISSNGIYKKTLVVLFLFALWLGGSSEPKWMPKWSICVNFIYLFIYLFTYFFFLSFLSFLSWQRGREGEREGEKHQSVVASHVPPTGDLDWIPGNVPWLGIELVTLWFAGWHSIHWATPVRAVLT